MDSKSDSVFQIEEEKTEVKRSTLPGDYMFKIESFSLLSDILDKSSDIKSFESPEFESGGQRWNVGGDGHISLYLALLDNEARKPGSEVNVMFNMFIFDQIRDKFLTIRDGKVRRFHAMKKESGFTRLISLEAFKNSSNGYLVDDCCVFGVEVFVIPSAANAGSFSLSRSL